MGGSLKTSEADAEGAGFSWATIRRAQRALGIIPPKEAMKGPWLGRLPPKVLETGEDAHSKR